MKKRVLNPRQPKRPYRVFVLAPTDEPFVDRLPPKLAEALRAMHAKGQLSINYEAAAEDLGVPIGTVKSRVFRARDQVIALRNQQGSTNV